MDREALEEGRQQRIVVTACDVHLALPGFEHAACGRLQMAFHALDRTLGVILRSRGPDLTLLTKVRTEQAAREHVEALLPAAASRAGLGPEELDRVRITRVESRDWDRTGRPRPVEAPVGGVRTVYLGERGRLCVLSGGPLGEWTAYLEADRARALAGRDLFSVLWELFELPRGRVPPWVAELIEQLAGKVTPLGIRYPCPCCDYLTLSDPPSGTYAICPVCLWEDDRIQFDDLDYRGGPNGPSLREARASVRRCGVSQPRLHRRARAPLPDEIP